MRENETAILKRAEKAIRAMCGVKLIEKRSSQELVDSLGLEKTFDRLRQSEWIAMEWACFKEG